MPGEWHIALTIPQSDRFAAQCLRQKGYTVYQPIYPKMIGHFRNGPNKSRDVMRAMFPGYLFVQDETRQGWYRLSVSPGLRPIHNLLMFCGADDYATLNDDAMAKIRGKERELCSRKLSLAAAHGFELGDHVRIEEGPFTGFLAQIETIDEHDRIGLLMSIFGRESRVSLPAEQLASAS